jgi:arylsulfatase A
MDWAKPAGKGVTELAVETPEQVWNVDFKQPIANGPTSVGFERYFGISASLDMVPYTFIENDRVAVVPTVDKEFAMMLGRTGGMTRKGPAAPDFEAEDVLPVLTKQAVAYIGERAADAKAGKPFFLYMPLASPHTPIVPKAEWQGRSKLNPYADFVMQTDYALGQLLDALDQQGLTDNTLLIVTSDNGCSPQAKFEELVPLGHNPSYVFRGHKADIFEGGHRIPFLARWPGHIQAGSKSEQTSCLTDFMATAAEIVGSKLPDDAAEDSVSMLPAFLGKANQPLREATVHHSINGAFAIRRENWKLCFCTGSGGWSAPRENLGQAAGLPSLQLYNLQSDIGEQKNVQAENPQIVEQLTKLMDKYVNQGRSTPGQPQKNAVAVDFHQGEHVVPTAAKGKGKKAK